MRSIAKGRICALLAGVFWGLSGTIWQYLRAVREVDTIWITTVRMLLTGIILFAVALRRNPAAVKAVWSVPKDAARLLVFALFGLLACQYTYMTAISHSNSATATALQYMGQALILFATCLKLRRLPTGKEWVALLLAMGGVFLLVTHGDVHTLALSPQAIFWGGAAALAFLLYTMLPGDLAARYGSVTIVGTAMLIGGTALLLVTRAWRYQVALDATTVICTLAIVLFGTVIAFTCYLTGVSLVGGVQASLLSCTEPVVAALGATLWLKTEMQWLDFAAIGMIVLMTVLLALPERRRAK